MGSWVSWSIPKIGGILRMCGFVGIQKWNVSLGVESKKGCISCGRILKICGFMGIAKCVVSVVTLKKRGLSGSINPKYCFLCPCIHVSIYPRIYSPTYPSIHVSIYPCIPLSTYPSIHVSIYPRIYSSTCSSMHVFIYL